MESSASVRSLSLLHWVTSSLICVLLCSQAVSQSRYDNRYRNKSRTNSFRYSDKEVLNLVEDTYFNDVSRRDIEHFTGNLVITRGESASKNLVVMRGDVRVDGDVEGSVVTIYGDILVSRTGSIEGDAIAIDGNITQEHGAWIRGEIVETSARKLERRYRRGTERKERYISRRWESNNFWGRSWGFFERNAWENRNNFLLARYNRVEGAFLGVRLPKREGDRRVLNRLNVFGEAGYGLESEKWRYQIGGHLSFLDNFNMNLGAEYHDFTDTQDSWLLPLGENNLSALFLKKDFFDYYRRRGFSGFGVYNITSGLSLKLAYRDDKYSSLENISNWSLLRSGSDFRLNPAIDEGRMRSGWVSLQLDTRHDLKVPLRGWLISAQAELAGRELGGDFEFDRYILDVRRYQPIGYTENFDFRLRAGTSRGEVPVQFLFDLGGIGSLPGYDFKEFTGNRVILFNSEYRNDGEALFGDIWFVDLFDFVLFFNAGYAWFEADNGSALSFDDISFSDLKTDVGAAIANSDGTMRLSFARRLDGAGGGLNVAFRISRHF